MRRLRDERGQTLAVVVVALLVSIAALVTDVGSWYLSQRRLQNAVDAAALAAAAKLPGDTDAAAKAAALYAQVNGATLAGRPLFQTTYLRDDTVTVRASQDAPVFFARLVGIDGVAVHAHARAQALPLTIAAGVVPIAVNAQNPTLVCGDRCFASRVTLTYDRSTVGAPGAFAFLDLSNRQGAAIESVVAGWVRDGYPDAVPLGGYESEPGDRWDSGPVRDALDAVVAARKVVLFPVYSAVSGQGENALYTIVGFAGFRLESWTTHLQGTESTITGHFVVYIHHGVGGRPAQYFGAKSVALTG
jgi:Flp pilus assembly protein TadG